MSLEFFGTGRRQLVLALVALALSSGMVQLVKTERSSG